MKREIFIVIRFSMLLKKKGAWKAGADSESWIEYKKKIFSKERLDFRMNLFKKVTLQSLKDQSIDFNQANAKVIVVTSDELPDTYMKELDSISDKYPWFEVLKTKEDFPGFKEYFRKYYISEAEKVKLTTIRLDDDDALSRNFLARIVAYQKGNHDGFALTFSDGYAAVYSTEEDKIIKFKDYYYSRFSAGLAYFDEYNPLTGDFNHKYGTVYDLGNHVAVDKKVPTISDPRRKSFIRLIHEKADTSGVWDEKIGKLKDVDVANIVNEFSLSEEIV